MVRASSLDRNMLGLLGTNVPMIMTLVFGVATAMGGLAGILAAPLRTVTPGAGVEVIIDSMIVVVIGGFGNFWGALLGALIIGEVLSFGILWMPELATVLTFIVMIVVLIVKPEGLLSKKTVGRK
jgi:branched-subunit amino acid ABC-type transport system permease component